MLNYYSRLGCDPQVSRVNRGSSGGLRAPWDTVRISFSGGDQLFINDSKQLIARPETEPAQLMGLWLSQCGKIKFALITTNSIPRHASKASTSVRLLPFNYLKIYCNPYFHSDRRHFGIGPTLTNNEPGFSPGIRLVYRLKCLLLNFWEIAMVQMTHLVHEKRYRTHYYPPIRFHCWRYCVAPLWAGVVTVVSCNIDSVPLSLSLSRSSSCSTPRSALHGTQDQAAPPGTPPVPTQTRLSHNSDIVPWSQTRNF